MSELVQARRRSDAIKDWATTLLVAAAMAVVVALAVELVLLAVGFLIGDLYWHREKINLLSINIVEWLTAIPILGWLIAVLGGLTYWPTETGFKQDLLAFTIAAYFVALAPAKRVGPALIARYDDETLVQVLNGEFGLRWAGALGTHQQQTWELLKTWCFEDAGSGASPLWRPWVMPEVEKRFSIAILTGSNGVGKSHLAEALCQHLDGKLQLDDCSMRAAGVRLRFRWKLRSCMWWRERQPSDPWDSGYLVEDGARRKRLAHFSPRRATLLVADELQPDSLLECLADLNARRVDYRHPVRLLIIDSTLPSTLNLRWNSNHAQWTTEVQELGPVTTTDLSDACFEVPQFRALVGAQRVEATGERLQLLGKDAEWMPFVEALDRQPILLAEAIRFAKVPSASSLNSLQREAGVQELLTTLNTLRDTPKLAPDDYGVRREVTRERVLASRVDRRESAIRAALGSTVGHNEIYHSLLLASLAGGVSASRLRQLMGWNIEKLGKDLLTRVFANPQVQDWVPPIKPAVVVDEMLRRHFQAPSGAILLPDSRDDICTFVRMAWLCNPSGTLRTVSRWTALRKRDEFAALLIQLPTLQDLRAGSNLPAETRVNVALAFYELAVCHGGEVDIAEQALNALADSELAAFEKSVLALLTRPNVKGLPALVLWLNLVHRRLPAHEHDSTEGQAAYLIGLMNQAELLVRQATLVYAPAEHLAEALEDAVSQILPRFSALAAPHTSLDLFLDAAARLNRRLRTNTGPPAQIRIAIYRSLAVRLASDASCISGDPVDWADALIERLKFADVRCAAFPDLAQWATREAENNQRQSSQALAWGKARSLALMALALSYRAASDTEAVVQHVEAIASNFPTHKGIQYESARAWSCLASAHKNSDPVATETAARRVAAIAENFLTHEAIQHESAQAWCSLAWAKQDSDPAATEDAAGCVAKIADNFPTHECIQHESAQAWRFLAWAHWNRNPAVTEAAARHVAAIAENFVTHEAIQHESAQAWCFMAMAHSYGNPATTEVAAGHVAKIAESFPTYERIQYASAAAWRYLAWAHRNSDPVATEAAAQRAAKIAENFLIHEGIQRESAEAWCALAWAHRNSDPATTDAAARRVAKIADNFPTHESIQHQSAQAWYYLAWAHRNSDPVATEAATRRVAAIAENFLTYEAIQHESAQAWCALAWAHRNIDPVATEAAAHRVAKIAENFLTHERLQYESAAAWCFLAWAHKDSDAVATEAAAGRVAKIADKFHTREGIQHQSALAWRFAVEAAVKFNDAAAVTRAWTGLDKLAGLSRAYDGKLKLTQDKAFPSVHKERADAYATVRCWKLVKGAAQGEEGDA